MGAGAIFLQAMASRVPGRLAILKGYQGFEIVLGSAVANRVRLLPRGIRRAANCPYQGRL